MEDYQISPDGRRVVYRADRDTDDINEIFSVPIEGGTPGIKLNDPLLPDESVTFFQVSRDSSRVIFRGDKQTAGVTELFSVPLGGPAAAVFKVNGPLATGGGVTFLFQISRDSGRVIYIADQDTNDLMELYMTSNYSIPLPLILNE